MKKSNKLITLLLLVFIVSCSVFQNVPKHPKEIIIKWHTSGGMLPRYETCYISKDSCNYQKFNNNSIHETIFSLSKDQIDEIYTDLYTNEFFLIESDSLAVQDRGGTEISIEIKNKTYLLTNLGYNFVKKEFLEQFNNIERSIKRATFTALEKNKESVKIQLDQTISNSNHNVILYVNDKLVYSERKEGEFEALNLRLNSNDIDFKILLMKKGNNSYQTVVKKYLLNIKELPDNKDIILTLVGGKLVVKK